jgi:hypothetical protein
MAQSLHHPSPAHDSPRTLRTNPIGRLNLNHIKTVAHNIVFFVCLLQGDVTHVVRAIGLGGRTYVMEVIPRTLSPNPSGNVILLSESYIFFRFGGFLSSRGRCYLAIEFPFLCSYLGSIISFLLLPPPFARGTRLIITSVAPIDKFSWRCRVSAPARYA